jgi:imidazolonepropionase-like amidohydrolase
MHLNWLLRPILVSPAAALALALTLFPGIFIASAQAQVSTARVEGLRDNTPRLHALTGVRLVTAPGKVIENGTVVLRDGIIVAAGAGLTPPPGARIWKLDGHTVYAGFIDMAGSVGVPAVLRPIPVPVPSGPGPRIVVARNLQGRTLASENGHVHPEQDIASQLEFKADDIKLVRELGFATVLAAPSSGIFRGQSALLNMGEPDNPKSMVIASRVAQHIANEVEFRGRAYPNSLMGAIAQVRQTFYDARWYRDAIKAGGKEERPEPNASLEALLPVLAGRQPVIYFADDEQDFGRIARLRDEFKLHAIAQGNGYEYRRTAQIKATGMPVIVPLTYPTPPEIENPDSALDSPLEALSHWEQAPSNLALIDRAGIEFAITANGIKDVKKDFWVHLRQAVKRGLPADKALAGLTTVPAKLLGEQQRLGTIAAGQMGNLVIASGDLFSDDKANIELMFVDGKPYATEAFERFDARGTWAVTPEGKTGSWIVIGLAAKPQLAQDGAKFDLILRGSQVVAHIGDTTIVATGRGDSLRGTLTDGSGKTSAWSAVRSKAFVEPVAVVKPEVMPPALSGAYPAGPYGILQLARPAVLLVKNATLWTSAAAGKLERADLLVRDGKIAAIGANLAAPANATVIDANGKHVSPGIIDAHSHTGIMRGINEGTSSITAEVRIGDVIDATNMNIYRELAGGVTTANVLHGSANTIGGQNQVIKLRWGSDAEGMKLEGAVPGIKFALGENVKQANWGSEATGRYPQTRMGVEQILRSGFLAARAYQKEQADWRKSPGGKAEPRRDLQLDTLVEILEHKRVVHIHSYRQDEILMFARFAKEFDIKVATFQHVLEGYKVADEIAKLGAGGSTFSDWWGYKMEVIDAIPYNGTIMRAAGVVVSFNSDSDELARRLNTEAAKAVKYGGISEVEALKFVTINPARQLSIEARTGSLEVGKDADFVIWNGNPLSTYARAEQTWIEGRRYFDLETDARLRSEAAAERSRLIAKALPARLAAIAPKGPEAGHAADRAAGAAAPAKPADVNQQYLALQRWLHESMLYRTGYWSGAEAHECTEEMP